MPLESHESDMWEAEFGAADKTPLSIGEVVVLSLIMLLGLAVFLMPQLLLRWLRTNSDALSVSALGLVVFLTLPKPA